MLRYLYNAIFRSLPKTDEIYVNKKDSGDYIMVIKADHEYNFLYHRRWISEDNKFGHASIMNLTQFLNKFKLECKNEEEFKKKEKL